LNNITTNNKNNNIKNANADAAKLKAPAASRLQQLVAEHGFELLEAGGNGELISRMAGCRAADGRATNGTGDCFFHAVAASLTAQGLTKKLGMSATADECECTYICVVVWHHRCVVRQAVTRLMRQLKPGDKLRVDIESTVLAGMTFKQHTREMSKKGVRAVRALWLTHFDLRVWRR
jgi:hypothetical protein